MVIRSSEGDGCLAFFLVQPFQGWWYMVSYAIEVHILRSCVADAFFSQIGLLKWAGNHFVLWANLLS
jgi:hypothetical protein